MSDFSVVLSNLINDKKADIAQLAAYCRLDRSDLYKIVKGRKDPPAMETILQISHFLRLTENEQHLFINSWQLTVLGSHKHNRRKSVEHFLLSFPEHYSGIPCQNTGNYKVPSGSGPSASSSCLALETQMDLHNALLQILRRESMTEKGRIGMLVQPDHPFLFHALESMVPDSTLTVAHVFCLSNTEASTSDHQLLHIRYLENIFSLFVSENIDYTPFYYHGDIQADCNAFHLFPYFIVTSECLLLCTPDSQQGILLYDPSVIARYQNFFFQMKNHCRQLFQVSRVDLAQADQFLSVKQLIQKNRPTYIIQEEGCLIPLLQESIIQEIVVPSLPQKAELVKLYSAWTQSVRATQLAQDASWMHQYFTRNGLLYFVRSGRFRELPPRFCLPASKSSRIVLLKEFQKCCKAGMYRMLRAPLEYLSGNLRLVVSGDSGYLVLCSENHPMVYLLFNERYLLEIIKDYMESLDDYCYSVDDTVGCIQEMIDSL